MMSGRLSRMIGAAAGAAMLALVLEHGLGAQAATESPRPADALVAAAVKIAQNNHKVVLIEFGASWCTWCRSFEAFVGAPEVAPIIDKNYVLLNLTVQERDDKKALENPGGQAVMNTWGGAKSGLPFYVFLDAAGKKIADSNAMPDGTNIGFPATAKELEMFLGLFDKTAPRVTSTEREKIVAYLSKTLKP